ncbi:uncharacterized protein ISCGN_018191 [Ixodes scapularis]
MSENLRSSGYHCVVFGCSNNFTKRKQNRGKWCDEHEKLQRECGCNVFVLHAFPTEPDLRRKWTASINREGFVPNSSSRVCSDHFIDGKRTECNPVPMLRLGYHRKVLVGRRRLDRVYVPPLKMQKLNQNAPQLSSSCFQGGKKPLASIATNVGSQSSTALRTTWLSSTQSLARSASTNIGPQSPTVTIGGKTGRLPSMSPARSPCATTARTQTPTVALTQLRRMATDANSCAHSATQNVPSKHCCCKWATDANSHGGGKNPYAIQHTVLGMHSCHRQASLTNIYDWRGSVQHAYGMHPCPKRSPQQALLQQASGNIHHLLQESLRYPKYPQQALLLQMGHGRQQSRWGEEPPRYPAQ